MDRIHGVFQHIIYTNEDDYHIFSFMELGKKDNTVVIYPHSKALPECGTGEVMSCLGEYEDNPKYGRQFIAHVISDSGEMEEAGALDVDDGYMDAIAEDPMVPMQFCPHCGHEI